MLYDDHCRMKFIESFIMYGKIVVQKFQKFKSVDSNINCGPILPSTFMLGFEMDI